MTKTEILNYIFRLRKVLAGKDFYIKKDLTIPRINMGNAGASWTFHPNLLNKNSIVYSFGVGLDMSFDLSLIESYGFTVHAFDPTPQTVEWINGQQDLPAHFRFLPVGLADFDGHIKFFAPQNKTHISHTSIHGLYTTEPIEVPVKRLSTFMSELQHSHIDLLKMDIEGSEYEVLKDLMKMRIPVKQLLVEFHHRFSNIGIQQSLDIIHKLREYGYKVFNISQNGEEVSFIYAPQGFVTQ